MPAVFVLLWSTGFIGAKYGLPYAEPFTFLLVRFAIVLVLMLLFALVLRAPWPTDVRQILHISVVGLLVHGVYLGGIFSAIDHGVSLGVSALIIGMQPILTAAVVGPVLGERVTARGWLGFVLGFVGVAMVVSQQISFQSDAPGLIGSFVAVTAISIGTLYQKRFCSDMDLRSGTCIQYVAAAALMGILAFSLETRVIHWTPEFIAGLAWLSTVLSVGAVTLLWLLIRRGAAAKVASLFYLVPPVTALLAYAIFDEILGTTAMIGMGIAALGVALVNR
ncbi:MAG: DMT family transporter [Gammaproteobacteria bacterium]|nr:DMT family transporter [Gammaproteobacteria bacterium]